MKRLKTLFAYLHDTHCVDTYQLVFAALMTLLFLSTPWWVWSICLLFMYPINLLARWIGVALVGLVWYPRKADEKPKLKF